MKTDLASCYIALLKGLRSYIDKSPADTVILGLSGGIDSAFCLALCVDALGADRVTAFALPSRYTADMSNQLAQQQCQQLNVKLHQLNIEPAVTEVRTLLQQVCGEVNDPQRISLQNIQSRIRGNTLMAISNELGSLLIATGNKSEYAMGYATLYGDMCGAYAPIKDVLKTLVYDLANWRNRIQAEINDADQLTMSSWIIPQAVIERPPTAELAPNQHDSDNLPAYEVLDDILHWWLHQRQSQEQIQQHHFPADTVDWVIKRLHQNEFKRRQAPPGTRITHCGFGRDYRSPICQVYF